MRLSLCAYTLYAHTPPDPACLCVWACAVCVFEFPSMNVHLCVFIIVCLAKRFTIKPYLSRNLELNVPSKNRRLNQCSHVSPAFALKGGSARTHTAESRKPQRDHRGEIPGLFQNSIYEINQPQVCNIYFQPDKNVILLFPACSKDVVVLFAQDS